MIKNPYRRAKKLSSTYNSGKCCQLFMKKNKFRVFLLFLL